MTFQRLLIMSIYRKKRNKDDKCHCELGNYRFMYDLKKYILFKHFLMNKIIIYLNLNLLFKYNCNDI